MMSNAQSVWTLLVRGKERTRETVRQNTQDHFRFLSLVLLPHVHCSVMYDLSLLLTTDSPLTKRENSIWEFAIIYYRLTGQYWPLTGLLTAYYQKILHPDRPSGRLWIRRLVVVLQQRDALILGSQWVLKEKREVVTERSVRYTWRSNWLEGNKVL